jgi:hypothetical protein
MKHIELIFLETVLSLRENFFVELIVWGKTEFDPNPVAVQEAEWPGMTHAWIGMWFGAGKQQVCVS